MKLKSFIEQIFFSTVRITVADKSNENSSIGTGFILTVPIDPPTNKKAIILLVSNKHVFGDTHRPIELHFHRKKKDSFEPDLGKIVTIKSDEFSGAYREHPDSSIDVACLNISEITRSKYQIYFRGTFPDMIVDFTDKNLYPGADVWFVGYPENIFDVSHNLPILRKGTIASIPSVNFNRKTQFLIDAQVFPGSSGSPLFIQLGKYFRLIGIVMGTMIKNERVEPIDTQLAMSVQRVLGLGIVIKSSVLRELIDIVIDEIKKLIDRSEDVPISENE